MISFEDIVYNKRDINQDCVNRLGLVIEDICSSYMLKAYNIDDFAVMNNCADLSNLFAETSIDKLDLSEWCIPNLVKIDSMFRYSSANEILVNNMDVSKVTSMKSVFEGCVNLKHLDISNWDTSKVKDMSGMFMYCNSLDLEEITLDISSVKYMFDIFTGTKIKRAYLKHPSKSVRDASRVNKKYFNDTYDTEIIFI